MLRGHTAELHRLRMADQARFHVPRGPRRRRERTGTQSHLDLSRAISGAIGVYHTVMGLLLLLTLSKKFTLRRAEMNGNHTLTFKDYEKDLIRPYAFQIASGFIFFALGVLLFLGITKKSLVWCESWLICTATMDFFVIIQGSEFNYPVYGIVWDVLKSVCEICAVWSYTMDLRKFEARLAATANQDELRNLDLLELPSQTQDEILANLNDNGDEHGRRLIGVA